jgi:hypothetical protein
MSQVRRRSSAFSVACALVALLAAGCSEKNGVAFDPDAGHPDDFFPTHPAEYRNTGGGCTPCHGSDLLGGISTVSCYSTSRDGQACHPGGPGGHQAGWRALHSADPSKAATCAPCHDNPSNNLPPNCFDNSLCHGQKTGHPSGWRTAHSGTNPSQASSCAACHDNPANNLPPDCFNNSLCHGAKSRHPAGWLQTHTGTDPGQASFCAGCHQSNPGTPGCFNNTLCHGSQGSHPAGWSAGSQHGATAKAAPGSSSGFLYCESCHGSGLNGGSAKQSCLINSGCHGWSAPHASSGWDGGGSRHRSTNQGNALVCGQCHQSSPGTPGCFNSTLCHGG